MSATALGYGCFACHDCGRRFNWRTGSLFNDLQYPTDVVLNAEPPPPLLVRPRPAHHPGWATQLRRAKTLLARHSRAWRRKPALLDEPTNHLDLASREAFEAALEGYDGAALIVTHDRCFIERFADPVIELG